MRRGSYERRYHQPKGHYLSVSDEMNDQLRAQRRAMIGALIDAYQANRVVGGPEYVVLAHALRVHGPIHWGQHVWRWSPASDSIVRLDR